VLVADGDLEAVCRRLERQLSATKFHLPAPAGVQTDEYIACMQSVQLLSRCQPALLDRWTPIAVVGDGNCMFRSVSFAMYGTQDWHAQLRFLACLEIGEHRSYYDRDDANCHQLMRSVDVVCPNFYDLFEEVSVDGCSCCVVALLALSSVLQVRINSFYPPLQSSFVSPLTVELVGRDVASSARSISVMWSTCSASLTASGPVDINHVVPLIKARCDRRNSNAVVIDSAQTPTESVPERAVHQVPFLLASITVSL